MEVCEAEGREAEGREAGVERIRAEEGREAVNAEGQEVEVG